MPFRKRAEAAAAEVARSLELDLSEDLLNRMVAIIESALISEARDERERCAHVALHVCNEQKELAHKAASAIRADDRALITNLMAMR